MASIAVTPKDIMMLDVKSDLAYQTVKTAVQTPEPLLIASAECLYRNDLGGFLTQLTARKTEGLTSLRKGGKRVKPIERYVVQCLLMSHFPSIYDDGNYQTAIVSDSSDGMGGLKAYLDADDEETNERSELFKLIQNKSLELRTNNQYDLILNSLDYVRDTT